MAEYTKVFDNPYPSGWEDLPSENTPITASALQEHTDAIEHIEQYLDTNPIPDGGTDVQWNQIEKSGKKIATITIDGSETDVYAPEGGGVDFEVGNELALENDKLRYKANYGTSADFEAFKQRSDIPDGATYHVTDDYIEGGESSIAEDVIYDNTKTQMESTNVQNAIDEVFQSVSNGKALIADAITDKGVPTSANDTFENIARNISQISGGSEYEVVPFTQINNAYISETNGSIVSYNGWYCTDYIDVSKYDFIIIYYYYGGNSTNYYNAKYNSSKSRTGNVVMGKTGFYRINFSDADKYFRFSTDGSTLDSAYIIGHKR